MPGIAWQCLLLFLQSGPLDALACVRDLSAMLPPELASSFSQCLSYLAMASQPIVKPEEVGAAAHVMGEGLPAPVGPPSAQMPAAAPTASNADGGAASVYALAVPPSSFQAGLPSRGRRGAPRATREVSPEAEFIPVGGSSGRSRSVPGGARLVRKTVPAQAAILSGSRYFSDDVLGSGPAY